MDEYQNFLQNRNIKEAPEEEDRMEVDEVKARDVVLVDQQDDYDYQAEKLI